MASLHLNSQEDNRKRGGGYRIFQSTFSTTK